MLVDFRPVGSSLSLCHTPSKKSPLQEYGMDVGGVSFVIVKQSKRFGLDFFRRSDAVVCVSHEPIAMRVRGHDFGDCVAVSIKI
jgi:hypothetical protein